ncbi:unnamed protein product [Closterium sp. Naga37s-1]|nr:unnamed protein product [Closterium sp. Naga37s-1]
MPSCQSDLAVPGCGGACLWWCLSVVVPVCGGAWLWWCLSVVVPGCGGAYLWWCLSVVVPVCGGAWLWWCLSVVVPGCGGACLWWCLSVMVPVCGGACLWWCLSVIVPGCGGACLWWCLSVVHCSSALMPTLPSPCIAMVYAPPPRPPNPMATGKQKIDPTSPTGLPTTPGSPSLPVRSVSVKPSRLLASSLCYAPPAVLPLLCSLAILPQLCYLCYAPLLFSPSCVTSAMLPCYSPPAVCVTSAMLPCYSPPAVLPLLCSLAMLPQLCYLCPALCYAPFRLLYTACYVPSAIFLAR